MKGQKWWEKGVVYQIYPRSFSDSNGDGVGDLKGVIQRLDHFISLGIEVIWLSPICKSPMADFGYDVSDYCDIDPLFGDLADFDLLIEEAHNRNIKVIIDYVPNHSSDQHEWFKQSRQGKDNPKRDWYIWKDAKENGEPPNNWGSFFGGPAWTFDEASGQYYLHQFLKEQPELNWRNPELRETMYEVLRFWLKRGVDGFRMDVIAMIIKDKEFRDNPLDPDAPKDLRENDLHYRQIQKYTTHQDDVHEVLREIRQVVDEYDDRCIIGELWGDLDVWVRYYGAGPDGDELHLPFNFRLMDRKWKASAMRKSVDELEAVLPPYAWPNYVLDNHDQPRVVTRFGGEDQARLAAMMLLTLRGTPTVYYGDELGMANVKIPADKVQDPPAKILGPERGRDGCRTPMMWDSSEGCGFSKAEPWLPFSPDCSTRNIEVQSTEPRSMYHLYRSLLKIRREAKVLQAGDYHSLDVHEDVYAYTRNLGDEKYMILLNFSNESLKLFPPELSKGFLVISTHMDRESEVMNEYLNLRAYEGVVLNLRK